jgi:hypothetical protein
VLVVVVFFLQVLAVVSYVPVVEHESLSLASNATFGAVVPDFNLQALYSAGHFTQ